MASAAAKTAYGPMSIAAAEQFLPREERIVDDPLAYQFLPSAGLRLFTRLSKWRAWRSLLTKAMGEGLYALFLCRKRYIDDRLTEELAAGLDAVVILGAGFDTRGYRVVLPAGVRLFEADLPDNIERKRAKLREIYGAVPSNAALASIDFDSQQPGEVLTAHGYQPHLKTFFVWEAVTQYLTEAGVRNTFDFLSTAAPGSRLVFTYIRRSFIDGSEVAQAEARMYKEYRRPKDPLWRFGLAPEGVPAFLREYGWSLIEQVGPADYMKRYIEPSGRGLPVLDTERTVYAEKTS